LDIIKNRKGSALIVSILVLAVLLILSTTMVSISSSNFEMSHAERRYLSAYYVAEAGIRHQIEHMRARFEELQRSGGHTSDSAFFSAFNNTQITAAPLILQNLGNDTARADIVMAPLPFSGNPRMYEFTSTATVGNLVRRIRGSVTIRWARMQPPPVYFERALFTDGTLSMKNNARIEGGVGTNASAQDSIELHGGASITGGILVGPGGSANTIEMKNGGSYTGVLMISPELIVLPSITLPADLQSRGSINLSNSQTQTIYQNGMYTEFRLKNSSHLTFNLTHGDLYIRVNGDLILDNASTIRTVGNNRLYMFVQGNVRFKNSAANTNENRSHNNFILLVTGNEIQLDNGSRFLGGIIAPNATLDMRNNSRIDGAAVVRTGDLDNSSNIHYDTNNRINEAGLTQHVTVSGYIPPEDMFIDISWREP